MSPTPVKHTDLPSAIRELTGGSAEFNPALLPGPGIIYLLALPERDIRYLGRSTESFPGSFYQLADTIDRWDELVDAADRAPYAAAFAQGLPDRSEASYRVCMDRRGQALPVRDYRQILRSEAGQAVGILGRLVDDSFRADALESLSRRCWKEIATTMTRRFLHDFNNAIAGIYSLSELYAEPGSDPKSMVEAMGHIRDCSIRAQNITRRIRHLTTLEDGQTSYFNLAHLAREQEEYLQALLPKGVPIHFQIEEGELPVQLDANRFRQAILHLGSNAYDAAGEEVELRIRVRRARESTCDCACLEFADNGPGFKPADLPRAAEPFFSTKNDEKHPGMGLAIVANFVESLGGSLEAANGERGAVIKLRFPLLAHERRTSPEQPLGAAAEAGEEERPSESQPAASAAPALLVYTWEDIARHPLLIAMRKAGWNLRVHLDPGQLLVDLSQSDERFDGVLVFKSALDERAEPLLSELSHARNCGKVAVLALGESVEAIGECVKRNCGFIAPGSSKPTALLNKLAKYYR